MAKLAVQHCLRSTISWLGSMYGRSESHNYSWLARPEESALLPPSVCIWLADEPLFGARTWQVPVQSSSALTVFATCLQ